MLASSQQFCVKWNSYSSNLQNVFPRLLTSEHFVDITLACEGQMIKCHKVVLSACSTYFEKLLVQNPCQHPIIFMKDMKHWEVQALVDFMYKGEVNVSQEELNSLLVAAEALQIRGLCGSDQGNTGKRENLGRPQAGENRLPTVSLPHDTVLSGRESPPFKRRRNIAEDQECKLSNIISPTQNNRASLVSTSSALEVNSVPLAAPSGHSLSSETDLHTDHVDNKKGIKQEVDLEDCYLEDADGPDEEYSLEQQEDSDSNNREDAVPASPMDQPGPSGMTSAPGNAALDKATTAFRGGKLPKYAHSSYQTLGEQVQQIQHNLGNSVEFDWSSLLPSRIICRWDQKLLQEATDKVMAGSSVKSIAKSYNIPRSTLRAFMKRNGYVSPFDQKGRRRFT